MNLFQPLFNILNKYIFSYLLKFFMSLCGNSFAASIFLFTLVINLLLIPLSIKSQKASVQQTKIKPRLDALKKKYGDDKQKYNAAMQKLYTEENVSMGGGCLPMLIRFILILSVYYLVISPLTYLTTLSPDVLKAAETALEIKPENYRAELELISKITDGTQFPEIFGAIKNINFNFFGIDLTQTPHFTLNFKQEGLNFALWVIPFLAFAAAMLSSIISMITQKKINPDAPSMAGMMLTMPLLSLFISFAAPASLGFYWACSSLIGGLIQTAVQQIYGPYVLIARENAKNIVKESEKESKLISNSADVTE